MTDKNADIRIREPYSIMKLKLYKPLIVFDLETTGLDLVKDRIIQLSYIKVYPDGHEERRNEFVNPMRTIPAEVTDITGINNDMVEDAPTFKELAPDLKLAFDGCDFAGFNSNHFDVPMLAEEFLRAGVDMDFSKSRLIDMQTIFHKMEPRNLSAAYKFYCGREMKEDFTAHRADEDTEATYRVLLGQLEMYSSDNQTDEARCLPNDIGKLAEISKTNDNVDFAGRIVWKAVTDMNGRQLKDQNGNPVRREVFNFGKYRGYAVADVLQRDPGYYSWILNGDFTNNTKQVLTRIRLREMVRKK